MKMLLTINMINDVYVSETLEALERGGMVKDYNSNSTNLDSEDEEDPRTPASVSSQVRRLIACLDDWGWILMI